MFMFMYIVIYNKQNNGEKKMTKQQYIIEITHETFATVSAVNGYGEKCNTDFAFKMSLEDARAIKAGLVLEKGYTASIAEA